MRVERLHRLQDTRALGDGKGDLDSSLRADLDAGPAATPAPADPCAVNLARPRSPRRCPSCRVIRAAISRGVPSAAGNFNECAQLSVVIVKRPTPNARTRIPGR